MPVNGASVKLPSPENKGSENQQQDKVRHSVTQGKPNTVPCDGKSMSGLHLEVKDGEVRNNIGDKLNNPTKRFGKCQALSSERGPEIKDDILNGNPHKVYTNGKHQCNERAACNRAKKNDN
jgi:hypothetical protein